MGKFFPCWKSDAGKEGESISNPVIDGRYSKTVDRQSHKEQDYSLWMIFLHLFMQLAGGGWC
jgi:hypothetical protein